LEDFYRADLNSKNVDRQISLPLRMGLGYDEVMPPLPSSPRPFRILLVEDHRDTREMYATFLEFEGMSVAGVDRGADALRLIQAGPPDLVVTDLHLPDTSGLDLTRQIKADPHSAHVAVVLLTGEAFLDFEAEARAAGCATVCLKPCAPDVLAGVIGQVLADRRGQ
jgi:CheY-like chemotaxis protein